MLPSVRLPRPSRNTLLGWFVEPIEPITTFCCAVFALLANWRRLPLVPIGPIVLSVTVAPVVAISAAALLALAATMPPVPAFRLIVPPLPFKAVPVPAPSSRMIWPAPPLAWTTRVAAPAVVATVAVVKVMLPVWAAVADGHRAGGGRLDLGQLGVGQVDARHGIVGPTQAHRPRRAATSG